jgi:hypothetical protein
MQIRRPLAALMTALALFGGGTTLTACGDPAGADRNDGTADNAGNNGTDDTSRENSEENGNLPNNSDPQHDSEDENDDTQDPD